MKKSRFTETQIIKVLKEVEGGRQVKEVCREVGISDATYYTWKSKYGGMSASDLKRLKELEEENRRLKQMYAELSLDHKVLKDVVEKSSKADGPSAARGLCAGNASDQRATSLPGHWHQHIGLPLSSGSQSR
tara:strand:- start:865 stop:1260 length:396 start_codon:yes stop_codon:yes gene_type:complete